MSFSLFLIYLLVESYDSITLPIMKKVRFRSIFIYNYI